MILGSALCAGARTDAFPMLLAGRGLEGVGSSGLMILIDIILSDKVSLSENAKNQTLFTFVYGIGFSIGKLLVMSTCGILGLHQTVKFNSISL